MTERLGDAPIDPEYRRTMNSIMGILDEAFNPGQVGKDRKVGLVLLVFPFGEAANGRCNYISNGASRKDMIALLRAQANRFEGQPEMKGTA